MTSIRLPGRYRLNLDALLARCIYRWHWRLILALSALLLLCMGPALLRGTGHVMISAAPGATILVDGERWGGEPLPAGEHTIAATLPDGRSAWTEITLQRGETLTVTLPAGLPSPRERPLQPAGPGTEISQVWWADNAWRVRSVPIPPPSPARNTGSTLTPTPGPAQTMAFNAITAERLTTIDAYQGLADQLHREGRLLEVVYRPTSTDFRQPGVGTLELRGWGAASETLPISTPLSLLQIAPDGRSILLVERVELGGEQAVLERPGQPREHLVAVPGHITRVTWRPDGEALVLHSRVENQLTLTLVRLRPTIAAAAIAELDATSAGGDMIPMTWDADGLQWIAPGSNGVPHLWAAPLTTLIPEQGDALDALAIAPLAHEALRVVVIQGDWVVVGRYEAGRVIGEAELSQVPPASDLKGMWQGDELLLMGAGRAWIVETRAAPAGAKETAR